MENILISDFITREKLKEQLKESVWKPNIKTRIIIKDKEPKRKLLINLEANNITDIYDKNHKFKPKLKLKKNGRNRKKFGRKTKKV